MRRAARLSSLLSIGGLLAGGLVLGACGQGDPPSVRLPEGGASAFEFGRAPAGLKHEIPLEEIVNGIGATDPKDKIRALRAPDYVRATAARHMQPNDRVLVLAVGADVRAFPLYILDAHEVVNAVVGETPVLVTWCPICGSGAAFERTVAGEVRTFGVSGYLWRWDVLLYDDQSRSFWSQIAGRAVVGPLTGTALRALPAHVTSWSAFREANRDAWVLSIGRREGWEAETYRRHGVYHEYRARPDPWPGAKVSDRRLPPKDEVLGVVVRDKTHAWSLARLRASAGDTGVSELREQVGGEWIRVRYERSGDLAGAFDESGAVRPSLRAYWFAWVAFHPETSLTP
jgi:hypothetical protein